MGKISEPASVSIWNNIYFDIDSEKNCLLPKNFCVSNKVQEISCKITHTVDLTLLILFPLNIWLMLTLCVRSVTKQKKQ